MAQLTSPRCFMVCERYPHPYARLFVLTLTIRFTLGMLVVLFLRCMAALFDPDHQRGKSTKWGIVSYTVAMSSVITALTGVQLDFQSICYIDNREFPGVGDTLSPGPLGYQSSIFFGTLAVGNDILFFLNGWLADGLLVGSLFMLRSLTRVSNTGFSCSSIAAT